MASNECDHYVEERIQIWVCQIEEVGKRAMQLYEQHIFNKYVMFG